MSKRSAAMASRVQGIVDGRLMLNASVALLAVTGVIGGMLAVAKSDTTDLHAESSSTWLAGGRLGRVFVGAIGGTRPSFGVDIGDPTEYDVINVGARVYVHDRATGQVTEVDAGSGKLERRFPGPQPPDDRAVLAGAGDSAYLVDAEDATVQKIDADGVIGEPVEIDGGFSDWVGADDGRLWLFDKVEGDIVTFDGGNVYRAALAKPGAEVVLSRLGDDPVVLDRTAGKLRWPRRSESIEIDGAATAVLQSPGRAADCVTVVGNGEVRCIDVGGVVRSMPMVVDHPETAQLFSSSDNLVVAWRDSDRLVTASWRGNSSATTSRPDPSGRPLVGFEAIGHLLVDDPGGGFAFSVDRSSVIGLEKYSKETVIIAADGQSDGIGVVATDELAGAIAELGGQGDQQPKVDNNGRNDPPTAHDDIFTTRVGRQLEMNVLANDIDPDGDTLAVVDNSPPSPPGSGEIANLGGALLLFTPGDTAGTVTFTYTATDPGQLTDIARVTIRILSEEENTDPQAKDDEFETPEGVAIEMPVLLNDVDHEGDELVFDEGLAQPAHGTVTPLGSKLVYTPEPSFTGTDSFTYFVVDGHGGRSQATVRVKVTPSTGRNRPPVAKDDRYSVVAGGSRVVSLLENDSDPDGDVPSMMPLPDDTGLSLTLLADGRVEIKAPAGTAGPKTFTYSIIDSAGAKASATVTVIVEAETVNRAPIGRDDTVTSSGLAVTVDPLANDYDQDNDPLTLVGFSQPSSGGRVTQVSDRRLRFDPNSTVPSNATISFTYTVSDPAGAKDTATVRVVINKPSGAPPIALPETKEIYPGETARLDVLANDSHPDGLDFGLDGPPSGPPSATLVVGPNSVIEFTPLSTELTSYNFRYCIKDVNGQTSCAVDTVTVVARPIENTQPVAENDSDRTPRDQPVLIDVLANDQDKDGDPLSIVDVGTPSAGTAVIVGRLIRYTPPLGFTGIASFTYTVTDGRNPVQTATVAVQVVPPATVPPIANDDLINLIVGDTAQLNPLANDGDPDGTVISLQGFTPTDGLLVTRVTPGADTLKVTSTTVGTYSIGYTIVDAEGKTAGGTIVVVVQPKPNRDPVAQDDRPSSMLPKGSKSIDVLNNDYDPDGGPVEVTGVSQPSPASAGIVDFTNSAVVFTPDRGFTGETSFTYTIGDGEGGFAVGTVTLTVNPCPPTPTVSDINTTTRYQKNVSTRLFGGNPAPGRLAVFDVPGQPNSVVVLDESTAKVRYSPPDLFNGTVTYEYTVTNECDQVATGTVTVLVNQPPTAKPDSANTQRNQSVDVDVLANDSAGESGDVLTIVEVGSASGGVASIRNGQVHFKPTPGSTATGSFVYTIADEGGLRDSASVTVTIGNDPPVAVDDQSSGTLQPGSSITVDVTSNDTDANGDALSVVASPGPTVSPVGAGSVSVSGGRITFTADPLAGGPITITYRVTDGVDSGVGQWTLTVNRPPTAGNTSNGTREGSPVTTNVIFGSASDPDGDNLSLVTAGPGAPSIGPGGTITSVTNGGDIQVTPDFGFFGTLTVGYAISDGFFEVSATLTITVTANTPPTVVGLVERSVTFTDPVTFDVFAEANPFDADGDRLDVTFGTPSGDGEVVSTNGGSITVHSITGAPGTFDVGYTVTDTYGATAHGTLRVTVN